MQYHTWPRAMSLTRLATALLASALLVVACGGDSPASNATSGATQPITTSSGSTTSDTNPTSNSTGSTTSTPDNPGTNAFYVSASVSGLTGNGLVLQNNGGDNLSIATNGSFSFAASLGGGATFAVTVLTQPSGQTCTITDGSGTITSSNPTAISVACRAPLPRSIYVADYGFLKVGLYPVNEQGIVQTYQAPATLTGALPYDIAATPDGKFVYTANAGGASVSAFSTDADTGAVTLLGSPTPAGSGSSSLVIDPTGRFMYVSNRTDYTISAFSIDINGALTPLPGSPYATGAHPSHIAISPNGKFVYTTNFTDNVLSGFSVDQTTGQLTELSGSPWNLGFTGGNSLTFDSTGARLYVTAYTDSMLHALSIDQVTGAPTEIGSALAGADPRGIAIHPNGLYAYVANYQGASVSVFNLSNTGAPSLNTTLTAGLSGPMQLAMDRSGSYLYVPNMNISQLNVYTVDATSGVPSLLSTFAGGQRMTAITVVSR